MTRGDRDGKLKTDKRPRGTSRLEGAEGQTNGPSVQNSSGQCAVAARAEAAKQVSRRQPPPASQPECGSSLENQALRPVRRVRL